TDSTSSSTEPTRRAPPLSTEGLWIVALSWERPRGSRRLPRSVRSPRACPRSRSSSTTIHSPSASLPAIPCPMGSSCGRFSCQNYAQGYYTAHANLAREELDAVLFLGDYIYEGTARGNIVREYAKRGWSYSLADYRDRYAQYKTDRDLQAAHAAFPWIVTWDDHEVENNYAGGISEDDPRNKAALAERSAGYQAFYEHMPVRTPRPQGPDLKLYRSLSYGGLATFFVLDTRQYRSPEVALCPETEQTPSGYCPASVDPTRTMLGADQRGWLLKGLRESGSPWNFVAQSVRFAQQDSSPDLGKHTFDGVDNWMGY